MGKAAGQTRRKAKAGNFNVHKNRKAGVKKSRSMHNDGIPL